MGEACHPCIIRSPNVSPNMFVYHASHGTSSIVALLKLPFGNECHTWHPPSFSIFFHFFLKLVTKILLGILLCALWCFCKLQRNWNFVIVELFSAFSLGAIIVKWAKSDERLNHNWVFFFFNFEFSIKRNFFKEGFFFGAPILDVG